MAFTLATKVLTPPKQDVKILDLKEVCCLWALPCKQLHAALESVNASMSCQTASTRLAELLAATCSKLSLIEGTTTAAAALTQCSAQTEKNGRKYYTFEFAAKATTYIRHALAVVTVGNGALLLCRTLCRLSDVQLQAHHNKS